MAKQLNEGEVQVGNRKIGPETVIQVNLKTLVIILGFLVSGLTTAWWNLSEKIEKSEVKSSSEIQELTTEVKKLKDEDIKSLAKQVQGVDGKLLDFFIKLQGNTTSKPPVDQAVPASNINPQLPR
jgi:hypothetical protein